MDTRSLAHFIWIGEQGLPSLYQQCLNSFAKLHPYWKIKLWTVKDVEKIIQNSKYDFSRYTTFINRYNFIKYHILAQEGGWFVDLDIQWKRPIDQIYSDKLKHKSFPDIFVPVRSRKNSPIDVHSNDDMLIYASKGIFYELLEYINKREDLDLTKKYEPYGPVSLSKWLYKSNHSREYLFESEIQENGYYCNHLNSRGWEFR